MPFPHLDAREQTAYTKKNRRPCRSAIFSRIGGVEFFSIPFLFTLFLFLSIPACSSISNVPPSVTKTPSMAPVTDTSQQFRKTPSPINPTQTPPPNPTPTRPACLEEPGQLVISEIEDPRLQRPLPIRIYLPPCYAEDQGHRYPTLYLLHGLGADDSQWDDLGIAETANHLISDERLPALLIVMPWHRTGIDLDDAISEVLIPFIDREYRTQPGAFWRAIGGISRGGGLALRIGMRHPDLFRSIGLHSPANIYSRPYITRWSTAISEVNMPRLWVDIGDRDPLLSSTLELISLLEELDIPALTNINSGEHSPDYWSAHLEDYLLWYADEWAKQL